MPESNSTSNESLHPFGELYGRWAFNFLIEVAQGLGYDFVVRPQNYRNVPDNIADILNSFRFKIGFDPEWPDAFQRTLSFKVLGDVNLASSSLREAAVLIYEHQDQHRREQIFAGFRDASAGLRAQVAPVEGTALTMICDQTRPIFERALVLFQDPNIARAFGLPPAPVNNWPLGDNFSGQAAHLVAEMLRGLRYVACLAGVYTRSIDANSRERLLMPPVTLVVPQVKFINLQKAAYYGSLTISRLLATDSDEPAADLIEYAYKWTKALQRLIPDVPRAWKDPIYRLRLTDLEWGLVPHPSGDAMPVLPGTVAAMTYTVKDEVCCSTGELKCDRDDTTRLSDFCSEYQCPSVV